MPSRPSFAPDWATSLLHAAGSNPWNGQPNKVQPSAGMIAEGFTPDADIAVEYENFILNLHAQWLSYLDSSLIMAQFADGSDGAVTFDGAATVLGLAPSSGVYLLTRDIYCTSINVTGATTVLNENGFRIYCRGQLATLGGAKITANGAPCPGSNTAGGTSATTSPAGTLGYGVAGGAGGTPSNGTSGSGLLGPALGGAGGAGGAGSGGTGGAGGTANSVLTSTSPPYPGARLYSAATFGYVVSIFGGTPWQAIMGGAGGGGGAYGSGVGGGGAGGAGVLAIAAGSIVLANATDLQCIGGAGGPAVGTNAGGGGGGGGGGMLLACGSLTVTSGGTLSSAVNCAGGAGGAKNGTGVAGTAGATGNLVIIQLASTAATPASAPASVHEEKGFAAITSGSGAGHEYIDVTFAVPFAAGTGASGYTEQVSISMTTDGDPIPNWAIFNKTGSGCRIRFTADFNGEVRWSAK